ncbi:hypothetical protein, partial [Escherichia coli]|uniref:hypothetical protein n=1 Tax=Escherichia coli TaxID=562 RepID=UPI00359371C0
YFSNCAFEAATSMSSPDMISHPLLFHIVTVLRLTLWSLAKSDWFIVTSELPKAVTQICYPGREGNNMGNK